MLRAVLLTLSLTFLFISGVCADGPGMGKEKAPPPPPLPKLEAIELEPASLTLLNAFDERRVLVVGKTADGARIDLTDQAVLTPETPIISVGADGYLHGNAKGDAIVKVKAADGARIDLTDQAVLTPETPIIS